MQIHIIDNLSAIQTLRSQWSTLFKKAQPGLFSHYAWVFENYRCFNPDNILLLAVYGDKNSLVGIFPFSIQNFRIKGLKFKALVHGSSAVTDYSQFIIDPNTNSRLMVKRVIAKLITLQPGKWDFFKIDNLNDDNDTSNLFKNMMLKELYAGSVASNITPAIDYGRGYQESKKIGDLKRKFKKIADDSLITHKSGQDISHDLLKQFSQLHQTSFPDTDFDKEQAQSFYKALIADTDINNSICISYILHEEEIIAGHFGFVDATTYYYYVPAYNTDYSKYGPGQYLLWKLTSHANEKQFLKFDFLRGDENYKFDWTNKISTNYTVLAVTHDSCFFKKLLLNLWLVTKQIPFFR